MFYCYQILCFSMSNYLNAWETIFSWFYSSLIKCFFAPQNSRVCDLNVTGYQMKA